MSSFTRSGKSRYLIRKKTFKTLKRSRDPNSDQTINLEVYDIDSRALLINCTTNDTAKGTVHIHTVVR